MKTVAAKDAKNRFGELIDTAQREPVTIEKHGRAVAVVMSMEEYNQLKLEQLRTAVREGLESGPSVAFNKDEFLREMKAKHGNG
jgi:prevent-host-death family protein